VVSVKTVDGATQADGATGVSGRGTESDAQANANDPLAASMSIAHGNQDKTAGGTQSGTARPSTAERKSGSASAGAVSSAQARAEGATATGNGAMSAFDSGQMRPMSSRGEASGEGSSATARESEAFASMDNGELPGKGVWMHAGSRQAEAGFQDPTLGWVSVRADLTGGSVHATLVPGSASAADALSSQVAGLHGYLAEHHSNVSTLNVATPDGGQAGMDFNQGRGSENPNQSAQGDTAVAASSTQAAAESSLRTDLSSQDRGATVPLRADGDLVGRNLSVVA
jgi:hypothetical protein